MDKITAGDGEKRHDLVGKAAISNATTCKVFELLNTAGIKTHFIKKASETAFVAKKCDMIPIEWVTRRVATGSFLKRNEGVKEGFRFNPPKQETFFKVNLTYFTFDIRESTLFSSLKLFKANFKMPKDYQDRFYGMFSTFYYV